MSTRLKLVAKKHWYGLGQRRCYCGVQLNWAPGYKNSATFEHIVPKSQGGTFALKNSLIICRSCNDARGNTCWIDWITQNNPPKAKWLMQKYQDAVAFYTNNNRTLSVKGNKNINIRIENVIINM